MADAAAHLTRHGSSRSPASEEATPRQTQSWGGALFRSLSRRSFRQLVVLWLVMVLGFGVAYWVAGLGHAPSLSNYGNAVGATWGDLGTAVYFSFVTATSVGFGDVVPLGPVRLLAILEAAAGLLLFGAIVSRLVSERQELLIEEIHRIAFEDRLGRVSTNLHMVLSELQTLDDEAAELARAGRAGRMLPRIESAAIVFAGEMRAIHDLLHRPQQEPEEAVLEALLANLAACLREFSDLIRRSPGEADRSPVLARSLRETRELAGEICGDCVPRAYSTALRVMMDRIQALAGLLATGSSEVRSHPQPLQEDRS